MPPDPAERLKLLEQAISGLTYPSESDEPFDLFQWNDPRGRSAHDVLLGHVDRTRKIEQMSMEEFFGQLEDSEDAQGYRRLRATLDSVLSECAVFRVGAGDVRVDLYVLGRLGQGTWAGIHTISVET